MYTITLWWTVSINVFLQFYALWNIYIVLISFVLQLINHVNLASVLNINKYIIKQIYNIC